VAREKVGARHANAVVHKTRGLQLAHSGIDQRIAGLSVRPAFDFCFLAVAPRKTAPTFIAFFTRAFRHGVHYSGEKIPPRQFKFPLVGRRTLLRQSRTQRADVEAVAQLARGVFLIGARARAFVNFFQCAQKPIKPLQRGLFTEVGQLNVALDLANIANLGFGDFGSRKRRQFRRRLE
jgi:hypothetical protein